MSLDIKKKNNPKINLDTLYFQTRKWFKEIGICQEELHLLKNIISEKLVNNTTEGQEHRKIYRNIRHTLGNLCEELKISLRLYEKNLFEVNGQSMEVPKNQFSYDQVVYPRKIKALKNSIRFLKRSVFSYLKKNPYDGVNAIFLDY